MTIMPTENVMRGERLGEILMSPKTRTSPSHSFTTDEKHYDEHLVEIAELERRFLTDRNNGLSSHLVSQIQNENQRLNLLPTDVEMGHGAVHELVGVLRDGSWIHTRAENLLVGDVITLKEDQCVPADVRIIECQDMWVDHSVLLGKRPPEPRISTVNSVFDDEAGMSVPYMEAKNLAFYGTTITRGQGRAIVIRTGEDTVLGTIAAALMKKRKDSAQQSYLSLTETMKQFEVTCRNEDMLPVAVNRVSSLVVEHTDVIKRTVISGSFGVNPPVIIEVEDIVLANETTSEELEREIALQMMAFCQVNEDAKLFTKALAACRHRVDGASSMNSNLEMGATSTAARRVPLLPRSSPIAAPVVIDPIRDQNAILRFSAQFGMNSPRNVSHNSTIKRMRYSTLLHGQISGCEVYVHFDQECGAHVVLLQGPAREILSRCGKVRRDASTTTMSPLETSDLKQIKSMVYELEGRNQTVVSFAELYLDPQTYPVGVKFNIENFNFPTSNMCYLGSLGLIEKFHPEIVLMESFARAAGVKLLIAAVDTQYPTEELPFELDDEEEAALRELNGDSGSESGRVKCLCRVPVKLREASTGEVVEIETCLYRSGVLSISNTLDQWKQILTDHSLVVFDSCTPAQIDLLVETLQELGECVGLVASGSANALALSNADIGFAIPTHETIDLSEEAADVVLGSATCPRSDAIRLIEAAKKLPSVDSSKLQGTPNVEKAKILMANLLRESIAVGRMLGLSETELRGCFETALTDSSSSTTITSPSKVTPLSTMTQGPPSPSKFPASAFRSATFLSPPLDSANPQISSI